MTRCGDSGSDRRLKSTIVVVIETCRRIAVASASVSACVLDHGQDWMSLRFQHAR